VQLDIKPAFKTVANRHSYDRTKVTHHPLEEGQKKRKGPSFSYETEQVESGGGYMVFFPQGHSVLIEDRHELERLGLHINPPSIAMELGEIVPTGVNSANDPEEIVKRSTKSSGRLTGGVEAALS
jgi:hypothetical protein